MFFEKSLVKLSVGVGAPELLVFGLLSRGGFPARRMCIPCAGTLSLCQKRSGTKIAKDAI
ncbi:hypothetical protein BEI61_06049 [Eisenbergiella tayi]|uniref:Uncharacterized protein n=1 Tax=Eisenbergiella tayi TaxID=1432052 RepID=A0A1E2ZZY0_9FIRM|nr:hypothetical protein BEI61_06049 [Eisenbergiella tayi]